MSARLHRSLNIARGTINILYLKSGSSSVVARRFHRSQSNSDASETVDFGFENVTKEEKVEKVKRVFSNVASNYDLMNDVMSGGIHRLWKERMMDVLNPMSGTQLIDVAGGTGDIAFKFLRRARRISPNSTAAVTVCDINQEMLNVGKHRAKEYGFDDDQITWVNGDAQQLPFESNFFDAYTIAFGIRNVVDKREALREALRVLKPGGMFICLEFSRVENSILRNFYENYSFNVIPVLGEILAKDYNSYQYLVESIQKFPNQHEFASLIKEAGFKFVDYENLTFGVAAIHTGFKNF